MDKTGWSDLDRAMAEGGEAGFWQSLAEQDLILMLHEEPRGSALRPQVFPTSDGALVLAFDRDERLAAFAPVPVPYARLPGRVVAALAAGQGLGLGLNLGSQAPSEQVLPVAALAWLGERLAAARAEAGQGRLRRVLPDRVESPWPDLVAQVLAGLEARLGAGLGPAGARAALAMVEWQDGRQGPLLALAGLDEAHRAPLAQALAQALALAGLDDQALDLAFAEAEAPLWASLGEAARQWRLAPRPAPDAPRAAPTGGPGTDPARPPRLR